MSVPFKHYKQLETTTFDDSWITTISHNDTPYAYQTSIAELRDTMLQHSTFYFHMDITVNNWKGFNLSVEDDIVLIMSDVNSPPKNNFEISFADKIIFTGEDPALDAYIRRGVFVETAPYSMAVSDIFRVDQVFARPDIEGAVQNTWEEGKYEIDDKRSLWKGQAPYLQLSYHSLYSISLEFKYWRETLNVFSGWVEIYLNNDILDTVQLEINAPFVTADFKWTGPRVYAPLNSVLLFRSKVTGIDIDPLNPARMMYNWVSIQSHKLGV